MSSSFVTKQLLNDVEDMQTAFEITKTVTDESISTLQTSVATKQDKITVLSDLTLKNVNLITMNNVSASSISDAVAEIPSLWSYMLAQLPYKQQILTTNSNISIKNADLVTLNSTPVSDIQKTITDVSDLTLLVNSVYDSVSEELSAASVKCSSLILNGLAFSPYVPPPTISGAIVKKTIIYRKDFSKYTNVVPARTGALLIASTVYRNYLGNDLLIEYGINEYNLSGLAQDTITALLQVVRDGVVSESYRTRQNFRDGNGGGSRSGTILPLIFFLNEARPMKAPSVLSTNVTLNVFVGTGFTDDAFSYDAHGMGSYFIITEIAP